ncbi:hypothetical protein evm_015487, partial [Chilo suppressalis]
TIYCKELQSTNDKSYSNEKIEEEESQPADFPHPYKYDSTCTSSHSQSMGASPCSPKPQSSKRRGVKRMLSENIDSSTPGKLKSDLRESISDHDYESSRTPKIKRIQCSVAHPSYDKFQMELFNRIVKNTGQKKINHDKYPPELRAFAITLHFYSPKAYTYVRNKFNLALPHPRVIRSWYSTVNADPGFSQEAFRSLKLKSEIFKQNGEKLVCALILDEMSLKRGCQRGRDRIIRGHVDIGSALPLDDPSELPECKDALVLMVVPLKEKWKLPIAYFLIKGLSVSSKSHLIKQALIRLHDVGVDICSLTLDGPPEHFSTIAKLGANMQMNENSKLFFLSSNK